MSNRPKILSIDDSKTNQKLIEKALSQDYEINSATSAYGGLAMLSKINPVALLLDADMPDIDGYKLCRMIRAQPEFAKIPILFITCPDSKTNHTQALQAGGSDFITEPVDIVALKQKLRLNLARSAEEDISPRPQLSVHEHHLQALHQFLTELITTDSVKSVTDSVLYAFDQLQLKGALVLHSSGEIISSIGPLTDLESVLLQQAQAPYPTAYAARYIWGGKHLGGMIQNMPLHKSDAYQQLANILDTIFTATNTKLAALNSEASSIVAATPTNLIKPSRLETLGFKFETALNELEILNEEHWSKICKALEDRLEEVHTGGIDSAALQRTLNQCIEARLALYEKCLEAQSRGHDLLNNSTKAKDSA